mgnify:CR=1 FL=1
MEALRSSAGQVRQAFLVVGDIQPVDRLGEPQVGIHAGHHHLVLETGLLQGQHRPHADHPLGVGGHVGRLADEHRAQIMNYLRATGLKVGLLINFNVSLIRDGIERLAL